MRKSFISLVQQGKLLQLTWHVELTLHLFVLSFIFNTYNYYNLFLILFEVNLLLKWHFVVFCLKNILTFNLTLWKLEHFFLNRFPLNFIIKVLNSMTNWDRVDEDLTKLELLCSLLHFFVYFFETRRWSLEKNMFVIIIKFLNSRICLSKPFTIFNANHHAFYLVLLSKGMMSLQNDGVNFASC